MVSFSATTLTERVRLAQSYVENYKSSKNGYWVALGKQDPWPNEDEPPLPLDSVRRVPAAFLFVYVHTCLSVYSDPEGYIVTKNRKFSYLKETDLFALASAKANKVYFEASISQGFKAAPFSYRIMGLCSDLETYDPIDQFGPGLTLTPDQVSNYYVSWIQMTSPINVDRRSSHVIQIVREF